MKKTLLTLVAIVSITITTLAQNVNIPDANFKAALLNNNILNSDANKLEISVAEAIAYNVSLDVSHSSITSLVGIEVFISLSYLNCSFNQLLSLDLTKNTNLYQLACFNNQLTNLDVTNNTYLTYLNCTSNPNLTCIQALNSQDKTYWEKDITAQYNENCNYTTSINDNILTKPKTISSIYNLHGQVVNTNYQGLVIIRYTDGTSEKMIQ